ncbi:Thioesterase superfamily [Acididesulfobacillus acetoxydans]|uniref:Thioesterase superfamily n=1 Tax=Acididesulfobacillus acetoxydans TaxID=1561005 RepID=A0A8S0WHI5_9FIRM|nr:transcription factor FapR [Acididesulfobacillus acetoxydans]CAA7602732.1 Thioesterase superfamily [Acididesulfobacillus acetoxydans]CEJ06411.1 Transcription factor FapR [Acididesulfobacillus acetoxydans]
MRYQQKERRQENLRDIIARNPLLTDRELAVYFGVSVPTIRLDRAELGIAELRQRTRLVANEAIELRALGQQEIVGKLLELKIGRCGRSELMIDKTMILTKAQAARGHHLFGQANSLAVALIDAEVALTGSAEVKFLRPVRLKERVVAEGRVIKRKKDKYWIEVVSRVNGEDVLSGKWIMFGFAAAAFAAGEGE